MRSITAINLAALALVSSALWAGAAGVAAAGEKYPPLDLLLSTSKTVIGEKIIYPDGPANMVAAIVTMQPGQETGWHRHDAPLFGYMLEGQLTVDYGENGERTYNKGDSLVEALGSPHNGRNSGAGAARILVVFTGAEGVANTVMMPK